jgi:hypothetical protein
VPFAPFVAARANQLAQSRTAQTSFVADLIVVIGKLPAFGVVGLVTDRLAQDGPEAPASPIIRRNIGLNRSG